MLALHNACGLFAADEYQITQVSSMRRLRTTLPPSAQRNRTTSVGAAKCNTGACVQLKALQDQASAEAAAGAALAEFEQVGARNEQDMEAFAPRQIAEILTMAARWARALQVLAETEAEQWLRAAADLGAEPAHVQAIAAL